MIQPVYKACVIFVSFILLCSFLLITKSSEKEKINLFFETKLNHFEKEINAFLLLTKHKSSTRELKDAFKKMRLSYKQLAVLTDYFNPYETKLLNGPAIKRIEEDNPQNIIEPHGFQVLEELLFAYKKKDRDAVKEEADYILSIVHKLKTEPDRQLKFTTDKVWQAIRMSVIRLTTLGITGFDSPIAQHSLQEAKASLQSLKELCSLYKEITSETEILASVDKTILYLNSNENFNSFNRLYFITRHLNPLYASIQKCRIHNGLINTTERLPLNEKAITIFEEDAFNTDFFSPNERYRPTPERIALGEKLFYDVTLSSTKTQSCGSCHQPEKAFTDGRPKALSIDGKTALKRNTPTLLNSVFQTRQFYDSRALTLETQLSDVVHNSEEMRGSLEQSVEDLKKKGNYMVLFKKAYPSEKDPISSYNIANAISSYVRTRIALNSRFDQYMRDEEQVLSKDEQAGFNLFTGKAKCATCHFIPLTNGLVPPEFNETESEVLGVPQTKKKGAKLDSDEGKLNHTQAAIHRFAFKTPTLRNTALTGPYMHNGVFETLEEVLDFYNKGGGSGLGIAPDNQTLPAEGLNLSKKEKHQIIAFLKSLTDTISMK
jgi:cytochrome c peroxidase